MWLEILTKNATVVAIKITKFFCNMTMAEVATIEWELQVVLKACGTFMILESNFHKA